MLIHAGKEAHLGIDTGFLHSISLPAPSSRGNLGGIRNWIVAMLFLLPLGLIFYKVSGIPGAEYARSIFSLSSVSAEIQSRVGYVLFVPLAAVVVVFFRVTLGIRLLGPFRSILLAVAFQITGIVLGLLFLILVIALVVVIKPLLRAIQLPYFGRVSVVLSAVAVLIMVTLVVGQWFNFEGLYQAAYFPIVVLTLAGDGFARTMQREGFGSALWRGAMTSFVAILITGMWGIPGFSALLLNFPELLILGVGMIIILSKYFGFRLFEKFNPKPSSRTKKKTKKSKKKIITYSVK